MIERKVQGRVREHNSHSAGFGAAAGVRVDHAICGDQRPAVGGHRIVLSLGPQQVSLRRAAEQRVARSWPETGFDRLLAGSCCCGPRA